MSISKTITRLAQWWIDRRVRAPRGLGFSVDDGLPDRGHRYGGAQTIHNTGTVDIVIEDGQVTEVWFRCHMLPFLVSSPKGAPIYGQSDGLNPIVAIELAPVSGTTEGQQ